MKRWMAVALAALLALMACTGALAEVSFEGRVIAGEIVAVSAPFGGVVESAELRVGDTVAVGDPVTTIGTTKVYATADGTVSGVFAREGDSTDGIVERYGAVVYIEPTNRFVIKASTEKAYNSSETKFIHIGEQVYLSCTKDGTHTGTAVVTKVEAADESGNTAYELEVTGGEFYIGETVGIFRSSGYASKTRIGRGTIAQNAAIGVKGSGSVLKLHVGVGDRVERGELLFETVEGTLDGLFAVDNTIVSGVSGIVAEVDIAPGGSVGKGSKLISVYPDGSFQIEVLVSELDLNDIHEGDSVAVEFDWDTEGAVRLTGTVETISRVNANESADAPAEYSAYIDFESHESVRLGMSVVVYMTDDEVAEEPLTEE